jgi:hypothetical protein
VTLRQTEDGGSWEYQTAAGSWRRLSDPDGMPTARQLLRLAYAGLLELRAAEGPALTKIQAAAAISLLLEDDEDS